MGRRDQKPGLVACPKPVLVKHDLAGWVTLASESEARDCKLKASLGYIMTLLSKKSKSWEYNSAVGHMPRMCNSVGSVPRVADRKTNKQKTKLLETKLKITKQNQKQLSNLNFAIKKKKTLKNYYHQTANDSTFFFSTSSNFPTNLYTILHFLGSHSNPNTLRGRVTKEAHSKHFLKSSTVTDRHHTSWKRGLLLHVGLNKDLGLNKDQ